MNKIKKFFNNPIILISVLSIICIFLLIYGFTKSNNESIYLGSISKDNISVSNIHMFSNNKLDYFYATSAIYSGEDKDIYKYEVGYYVKNNDEYISFLTRSGSLDNAVKLSDVINDFSGWNYGELTNSKTYFTSKVKNNLDKIYFIVKASTSKDGEYDINIVIDTSLVKY